MAEDKLHCFFMSIINSAFKIVFIFILLVIIPLKGISGNNHQDSLSLRDSTEKKTEASKHSLYTGMGYGSNMIYLGSTISGNQPFEYGSLTYGYNNEFFAGFSTYHLSASVPFITFYSGSLNYSHAFNSWLDISAGLSGYRFTREISDTLLTGFLYGDLTIGFDWKILYSRISVGALISDQTNGYLQIMNSRYFQTASFIKDKVFISFDPYFNFLFGNLLKSETTYGTSIQYPGSFGRWKKRPPVYVPSSDYSRSFGMMEIDLGIPVALNFKRATIEAEASYIIPTYDDSEMPGPKGFVFLLTGFFRIF